ncbi:MAG: S8 family serine peptidase [Solirubrobacteraceae bacterium MAG38_C4-C5]|nr:S8 family serine peptidase [Candidatus Siliceabacter maunaloa]
MPQQRRSRSAGKTSEFEADARLVVIVDPQAGFTARGGTVDAAAVDAAPLASALDAASAGLVPLFGPSEDRVRQAVAEQSAATGAQAPDLSRYYTVEGAADDLEGLAEQILATDGVVGAYVAPAPQPAVELEGLNEMVPAEELAPPISPDFTARQIYLDASPAGIDARFAWTLPGGRGAGVRIIDIEGAWRFDHEDLIVNQGGVVGTQRTELNWRNHGTAVVSEYGGDVNPFGVTGICPDAHCRGFSFNVTGGAAAAIRAAADALSAGDIILIELHAPGPGASGSGQDGFIAMEWWPAEFDAMRYASNKGVIVVEAAGNGSRNLDDPIYNTPQAGFPASWRNPFNRAIRDSGAVVVGAGAPPSGTHGRDHGPDRSRLGFSNWGSCVDVQGWGREVTAAAYGDLQGGTDERIWYTDQFSGTSSASPIVVGALGCIQGVRRAQGQPVLNPATARQTLRTTGSPQQDAPGRPASQRIGNRPNLRQVLGRPKPIKEFKELKEPKEHKEFKEHKIEVKERPDKNLKVEIKEKIEIKERGKDKIEIKERPDKHVFEHKLRDHKVREVLEQEHLRRGGIGAAPGGGVEERMEALEQTVSELMHFIGGELRPDLGAGALGDEPDLGAKPKEEPEKLAEGGW